MSENEDIDALAAEYVLGTLDAGERAAVAARRNREPNLAATIEAWERRLGPLALAMPSVPAPAGLLAKIEERIQRHESERQGFAARIVPDAPLRPDLGGNVVMFESRIRRAPNWMRLPNRCWMVAPMTCWPVLIRNGTLGPASSVSFP